MTTTTTMAWDEEIRTLASDFLIDRKTTERIIRTVSGLSDLSDTDKYRKAWKKLFPLM